MQISTLEGLFCAFLGAPVVAVLAESYFGYVKSSVPIEELSEATRNLNAKALGKAIMVVSIGGVAFSFIVFALTHITYAKDKKYVAEVVDARKTKKMEQTQRARAAAADR